MSVLFQQQVLERRAENVRRYRSCDRKEFQCVSTLTTNECSGRSEGDTRPRSSVMMSRGHRVRGVRLSLAQQSLKCFCDCCTSTHPQCFLTFEKLNLHVSLDHSTYLN